MPCFDPDKLSEWTGAVWTTRPPRISGFSHDTRRLRPGELFVALETESRDGHEFLPDASTRGAAGALVRRLDPGSRLPQLCVSDPLQALHTIAARHRREFQGPVVAITGSCGKTSTKEFLVLLLGEDRIHRSPGNFNNQLGVPLSLLELDTERHDFAVLEVGANQRGEIDFLAGLIEPSASIITNVAPAHLEGFGSVAEVAREKAALGLRTRTSGSVIFPHDCLQYEAYAQFTTPSIIVAFNEPATTVRLPHQARCYRAETTIRAKLGGCRLVLRQPPQRPISFDLPPVSPGMAKNCALAIVAARTLGVSHALIRERMRKWTPPDLRGEILQRGKISYYVDCYNANPASLADALEAFEAAFPSSLARCFVLGCMAELGPRSAELHRQVGRMIRLREDDLAMLLGEYAGDYRDGLEEAGNAVNQVMVANSKDEIVGRLGEFEGAVLLKGSRLYALETVIPADAGGNRSQGSSKAALPSGKGELVASEG